MMTQPTGQWVEVPTPCQCGKTATRCVGQLIENDVLWWDSEFWCPSCETYWCEGQERGAAPDEVRDALLSKHGAGTLRLTGPTSSLVMVLKVMREVQNVSLAEARTLAGELSRDGLVGTWVEMELLRQHLQRRGVAATVGR